MTATSDASAVSDEDRTALTDTVTRFARTEIAPHVDAWDAAGEFPRSLYRRAADLGLLGLGIIYGVKPFLFGLFAMIPQTAMDILCGVLTAIILTDAVISTTVLGKIRHTAELTGGDDTETITRSVRDALLRQGALVRRTLRAFPYAKLYNKPLLERLRQRQQMLKADFQAKQQHMREELAQREQALREEMKKRKPQKQG